MQIPCPRDTSPEGWHSGVAGDTLSTAPPGLAPKAHRLFRGDLTVNRFWFLPAFPIPSKLDGNRR
jgi:hypothetical protein